MNLKFDYVITGAGAAGLSLAVHLINSGLLRNRTLAIIEKEKKDTNDRTWCFWEMESGPFEKMVFRSWDRLMVADDTNLIETSVTPYRYKMLRGGDFYQYCRDTISAQSNITWIASDVISIQSQPDRAVIETSGGQVLARHLFNSIIFHPPSSDGSHHLLLQHFKGIVVRTQATAFDPHVARLMDFRVPQSRGTSFVYLMPFSETEALIEYTEFSASTLADNEYDLALSDYCHRVLHLPDYEVTGQEVGVIPMTNYPFETDERRITHIGTAGAATKASSGYTFRFIQKQCSAIVSSIRSDGRVTYRRKHSGRFGWYDATLLNILTKTDIRGADVFMKMFTTNPMQRVLRFLDNESTIPEEIQLIRPLPVLPFMKAGIEELSGRSGKG
jgi:lycopene beta-cyclase